jgi:hypothetical protein
MKRCIRWVYDWITVLTASLVGVPTLLLQLLSFFGDVDLTPFVGAERALQIVTAVAILKGVLASIESLFTKEPE